MNFTPERVRELARRAYAGDAGFPLVPGRAVLLVIDMQDEFVRPGWTAYWVPAATCAVPRIRELIACCRRAGVPVIYYTAFGSTHRFLDRPRSGPFMPGRYAGREVNQWFEPRIWAELAPEPDEIVLPPGRHTSAASMWFSAVT